MTFALIKGLFSPPKDDSPEAGLSGDLDELPEEEKREDPELIDVQEVTEED